MARLYYECNFEHGNDSNAIRPYACTPEYCSYCCCEHSHCCFVVQRRPSRHLWETWYFWLGVALLAVFIISSVSSYVVNNYRHNIQGISFRHGNRQNGRQFNNQPRTDQNQVSISIIPTAGMFSSQRKMLIIGAQPSITHMTPIVA